MSQIHINNVSYHFLFSDPESEITESGDELSITQSCWQPEIAENT